MELLVIKNTRLILSLLAFPNLQHAVLDLQVQATIIELSNAKDRVLQPWDVEESIEGLVLAFIF